MKTLFLYVFIIFALSSYGQNDSIVLTKKVLKCYNELVDYRGQHLTEVDSCLINSQKLDDVKQDKVKLSVVLGNLYYIKATRFKRKDTGSTGFKHKGYVAPSDQKECLEKAKKYFMYYLDNVEDKGTPDYRDVESSILRIDKKLEKYTN